MQESAHGYLVVRDIPAPAFPCSHTPPPFRVSVGICQPRKARCRNRQMSGSICIPRQQERRSERGSELYYYTLFCPRCKFNPFPARRRIPFFTFVSTHGRGQMPKSSARMPHAASSARMSSGSGACTVRAASSPVRPNDTAPQCSAGRAMCSGHPPDMPSPASGCPGTRNVHGSDCAPRDGHHPQRGNVPSAPCQHPVFRAAGLPPPHAPAES